MLGWFLVAALAAFGIACSLAASSRGRVRYEERWPRLSDDEFIARCAPGTSRETALRVRRIVSEQLGIEYERIYPEQSFVRDLGCE